MNLAREKEFLKLKLPTQLAKHVGAKTVNLLVKNGAVCRGQRVPSGKKEAKLEARVQLEAQARGSRWVNFFLASQDALEVIGVTASFTEFELADLTDVTLVNDDTNGSDEEDEEVK